MRCHHCHFLTLDLACNRSRLQPLRDSWMPLPAVPQCFPRRPLGGELEWRIVDAMSDREVTGQTGVSAHGETRDGGPPAGVTTFAET
jgi:hypothetical protein